MKRQLIVMSLAVILLGVSALAVFTAIDMGRAWGTSSTCSIGSLTSTDLSLLTALYPELAWTAYAQSMPLTIVNDELPERTADASVLSFLGKSERIAFLPLVSGRLSLDGEMGVCALDVNTAFELFKSKSVDGNMIRLNGKTMRVVGVMDVDYPLVLIPAEQGTKFTRLAADGRDAMLLLASTLEVEPDPFELSGEELTRLAWFFCAVPWLLAAVFVLASLRKRGGWWRAVSTALFWALSLGGVLTLLLCVPVRLLPARWSDMAFYGEQAAALRTRPFRVPDVRDELLKQDVLRVGMWCACACIVLWMERMWLRCGKSR